MKKTIFALLIAILVCFSLCLSASAEEAPAVDPAEDAATNAAENTETVSDVPWSTFVSDMLGEYAGEILSALAFAGSGILIFLFKKGLLPTISKALVTLGDKSSDAADAAKKALDTAADVAKKTAETVDDMNVKMQAFEKDNANKIDSYKQVLTLQTDMIGTLLLNLRLTPDQRGAVEKTMEDIKKAMEGGDAE